ncbi:MAG: hypothetical protein KDA69_21320, partial [Planctomycetaceae bacterium]|nr:hypothetical protein [Planctomycetaceae bacterium]
LDSTGSGTWSYLSCDKLNPTAPGCNLKRLTWHNENIRYEGDEFIHGRHWPAIGKALHPGFKGKQKFAVLRWTSLVEGDVSVHGTFTGYPKAKGGNGVRVVIFVNGQRFYASDIARGDAKGVEFDLLLVLNKGTNIDFVVDSKGHSDYDTTPIDVTIERLK